MTTIIYISVLLCACTVYGSVSNQEYLKAGIITEENVLVRVYSSAMCQIMMLFLQKMTLPKSDLLEKTTGLQHTDLLKILNELVGLSELKAKVEKAASYSPNQHLQGLSVLLAEVVSEGCTWVSRVAGMVAIIIMMTT